VWASPYDAAVYEVEHHDGLLDVTGTANYVTASYNHFHDHNKTTLIGSTDTASLTGANPSVLKTTLHHNYYQNVVQRQPRATYGMVHIFSNYYTGTKGGANYGWSYAWGANQGVKVYAENNVFDVAGSGVAVGGNLVTSSTSSSKVSSCAALSGMSTAYCSPYMYDTGTVLNGASVNASSAAHTLNSLLTVTSTPWPSASNPTGTPSATPSSYYSYSVGATTGLATSVPANAGVGHF
jgi:pectate lyase